MSQPEIAGLKPTMKCEFCGAVLEGKVSKSGLVTCGYCGTGYNMSHAETGQRQPLIWPGKTSRFRASDLSWLPVSSRAGEDGSVNPEEDEKSGAPQHSRNRIGPDPWQLEQRTHHPQQRRSVQQSKGSNCESRWLQGPARMTEGGARHDP